MHKSKNDSPFVGEADTGCGQHGDSVPNESNGLFAHVGRPPFMRICWDDSNFTAQYYFCQLFTK
jgi:hypothetical protein